MTFQVFNQGCSNQKEIQPNLFVFLYLENSINSPNDYQSRKARAHSYLVEIPY